MKRSDGDHCFFCNANVDVAAERCQACGRGLAAPEAANAEQTRPSGTELRFGRQNRWRGYWPAFFFLVAAGGLLAALVRPKAEVGLVLPEPAGTHPVYTTVEVRELPGAGVARLSIVAQVAPGTAQNDLKATLDWVLCSALNDYNRRRGGRVRVIWAYLLEDSAAPRSEWRAMAIWTDPQLPQALKPAGIGGDAVREGSIEYDFTNPVLHDRKGG